MMKKLFLSFAFESCSLSDLRDVTIYFLAFAGFFRINELLSVKRSQIEFFYSHCEINIIKSN